MQRKTAILIFVIIVLFIILTVILAFYIFKDSKQSEQSNILLIANWNLQIFGDKKASNRTLMEIYAGIIGRYDVVFLQEIRDADNTSFQTLCAMLTDHDCWLSSRAGRTSSKEQYGVIYLKTLEMKFKDYNPDILDRWERPPIRTNLKIGNYSLSMYNIHIKPNETARELKNLEGIIAEESLNAGNIIVLGDLNADCSYASADTFMNFKEWHWIIKNSEDTTTGASDCAYDRILMNADAVKEYYSYGIYKNVSKDVSDHYLIWVAVAPRDKNINYRSIIH